MKTRLPILSALALFAVACGVVSSDGEDGSDAVTTNPTGADAPGSLTVKLASDVSPAAKSAFTSLTVDDKALSLDEKRSLATGKHCVVLKTQLMPGGTTSCVLVGGATKDVVVVVGELAVSASEPLFLRKGYTTDPNIDAAALNGKGTGLMLPRDYLLSFGEGDGVEATIPPGTKVVIDLAKPAPHRSMIRVKAPPAGDVQLPMVSSCSPPTILSDAFTMSTPALLFGHYDATSKLPANYWFYISGFQATPTWGAVGGPPTEFNEQYLNANDIVVNGGPPTKASFTLERLDGTSWKPMGNTCRDLSTSHGVLLPPGHYRQTTTYSSAETGGTKTDVQEFDA